MDPERDRIQADLRGLLDGDVRCDDTFLQMYACDASIFEVRPLGVVRPRGVADVVATVEYAAENNLPIHPRGAGTGLAGESLGPGLVLDFSTYMRRILEIGPSTARMQPGVVHGVLNRHLAPRGLLYGPDPATASVSTMGSVLALDTSGSHWLRYGSARDRVERLQVVLSNGDVVECGRHAVDDVSQPVTESGTDRRRALVRRIADLLDREQDKIQRNRPRTRVNTCGYRLDDVWKDGVLDLARLLTGSEGTLAIITEATVTLDPLPQAIGVLLLFFDRLEFAAKAASEIADAGISACDLMDRRLLAIAREADVRYDVLIPSDPEAMLLVEMQGESPADVRQRLQTLAQRLVRRRKIAFDSRITIEPDEVALYWNLARNVIPRLYRLKGSSRALPFVEDMAVPPDRLPAFLKEMHEVLKKHQVTASLFGHFGHGQLHVRPFLDLADPDDMRRMQGLAADLYARIQEHGGTISGEHGDGLSRTPYVRDQSGELYDVFRELKRIFDPQNILNPGKVVADAPQPLVKNLRAVTAAIPGDGEEGTEVVPLQLVWQDTDITYAARNCNGCGRCRTQLADARMCPMFRFAPREEAAPRSKANLLRGVLTGRLEPAELAGDDLKQIADLCFHCHQCRLECPASVDIPKLATECKAQYVATNGLRPAEWWLTRIERLLQYASFFSPVANWALRHRSTRWLLERIMGIAQGRKLPRVAGRTFLQVARRHRWTRPSRSRGPKVLFFLDLYPNWHDVQLGEALVRVFQHNGISVYVPPQQAPSGMIPLTMGAVERARKLAQRNVRVLAEAVRQGYDIVATEPAAALCLSHEYPNLLDDDDTRLVAENTYEACSYLWRLHQQGTLELDLKPLHATLAYHLPCHLRALGVGTPGLNLLRLIPGLTVEHLDAGCSGMAGTFGLQKKNYRTSLRAGWGMISSLRRGHHQVGTTECSACKLQMEQATPRPTIHPLKLLALSYGEMPEVADLLHQLGGDLIVT